MSPERIAGEAYSYPADVWSLGLTVMTCALGRFPYSQSGGYWGLLNEMKAGPVPELPATFSAEFRDFIGRTLVKDPARRPSARELLGHPFVAQCSVEEPEPELEDGDGSETARLELDEVVHVVREFYRDLWREQSKANLSPTIPNFHRVKIRNLASELGIAEEVVRLRFAWLSRQLRADVVEYWADAEADENREPGDGARGAVGGGGGGGQGRRPVR
jgi:serine/threonine protein kinase